MAVTSVVLKKGLQALGEAYRCKVDAATESLWRTVCSDLNDEQFRYGVGIQLRSVDRFFPPPGVVLAYGYAMPRESDTRPLPKLALPEHTPESEAHLLQAVRDNPISDRENNGGIDGRMHYIRRIANRGRVDRA